MSEASTKRKREEEEAAPATEPSSLRIAVVCASNMNRSMEAHRVLLASGFSVNSYGTNSLVRMPGATPDEQTVFKFGTRYLDMYEELKKRNLSLYSQNGTLKMLKHNSSDHLTICCLRLRVVQLCMALCSWRCLPLPALLIICCLSCAPHPQR